MAENARHDLRIGHPAPQRHQLDVPTVLFILLVPPAMWLLELLYGFASTSYWCNAGRMVEETAPVPGWLQPSVSTVNVAAILVGVAGIVVALAALRRTAEEHQDRSGNAAEAGEGRTRVFAIWGLAGSSIVVIAMLMNTFSLFLVPQCSP